MGMCEGTWERAQCFEEVSVRTVSGVMGRGQWPHRGGLCTQFRVSDLILRALGERHAEACILEISVWLVGEERAG